MSILRWRAVVHYRADAGLVDVTHDLEEIADLHGLVEAGPHWDTIHTIEVKRVNHVDGENLTVEQAEKL